MAVEWLKEEEQEIFKYVKNNADKYAQEIYYSGWSVYSDPGADIRLDKLETVMFAPEDVTLPNTNWVHSVFGTTGDFREFSNKRNRDVKFCVYQADELLDSTHPAFNGVEVWSMDYVGKGDHPSDGHGTAVASMYGSSDPRYSPFPEIAKNQLKIIAGTVLYGGSGDFNNIVRFLEFVAKDAPKKQQEGYYTIINMSLGADAPTPPNMEAAITACWEAGVFVLCANGNSGLDRASTPANAKMAQGVMALTPELKKAQFSNVGPSTVFAEGGVMNVVADRATSDYGHQSGTSFSSPYAVNAVIAALSLYPEQFSKATDCLGYLTENMLDLGEKGRDDTFGWGKPSLGVMLSSPPKKKGDVVLPKLPKLLPKKRTTTLKSIKGWEISYKSEEETAYNTIFIEEMDISYSGFYSAMDVEEKILPEIALILNSTLFTTSEQDYTRVAKLVLAYVTKKIPGLKITYTIIDNNQDGEVVVILNSRNLNYWSGVRSVLRGKSLKDKKGKTMLVGK